VPGLARVALQPVAHFRCLVCCVVIQDRMDDLAGGDITLQGIQEANELLMSVALNIAGEDRAGEDVESGEQRRRSVALVVMGHRAGAALFHGHTRLGPVERLHLALLIDGQDDGVGRRADIKADDTDKLSANARSFESLNARQRCGARPCAFHIFCTVETARPICFDIACAV